MNCVIDFQMCEILKWNNIKQILSFKFTATVAYRLHLELAAHFEETTTDMIFASLRRINMKCFNYHAAVIINEIYTNSSMIMW